MINSKPVNCPWWAISQIWKVKLFPTARRKFHYTRTLTWGTSLSIPFSPRSQWHRGLLWISVSVLGSEVWSVLMPFGGNQMWEELRAQMKWACVTYQLITLISHSFHLFFEDRWGEHVIFPAGSLWQGILKMYFLYYFLILLNFFFYSRSLVI